MSEHDCEKCEGLDLCRHVRQDDGVLDQEERYVYRITYVGGYAVITSTTYFHGLASAFTVTRYETMVMCVGSGTVGDVLESSLVNQRKRILYHHTHNWDFSLDVHNATVLGLHEKMLALSE